MHKTITIILAAIILIFSSCSSNKRKNFILLLDNSQSIKADLFDQYLSVIQNNILKNMGKEDRLTLQFIDECSQSKAERIFFIDLAQTDFTDKMDGVNIEADSNKARINRFINDSLVKNIHNIIRKKRTERIDCGEYTDIISALKEANSLLKSKGSYHDNTDKILNNAIGDENYTYENCIIIFSDMVNENALKTLDFTTYGNLNEEGLEKKFDLLNSNRNISDLNKCNVLVYGATSSKEAGKNKNAQIENIKTIWQRYFKSAGATLVAYGYDTRNEISEYVLKE